MNIKIAVIITLSFVVLAAGVSSTAGQQKCTGNAIFTERSCVGDDIDRTETDLLGRVNEYRKQKGIPPVNVSADLSLVANRHLLDLLQNVGLLSHSWSNCPYDVRITSTWACILDAPQKFPIAYRGEAYETLYRTTSKAAQPQLALDAWKKSTLHNSIILNLENFADKEWDAVGVSVNGQYAALWFGSPRRTGTGMVVESGGIGVTLAQAVDGLADAVNIKKTASVVESGKWVGATADGKVKIELLGSVKEVAEASARLSIQLENNGKVSERNLAVLTTLLRNVFPDWATRDEWLSGALSALAADRSSARTHVNRKILVELRSGPGNTVVLNIRPESRTSAIEF